MPTVKGKFRQGLPSEKRMIMGKRILLGTIGMLFFVSVLLAQDVPGGVAAALKKGNAQELGSYLGDKVNLIIQNRSTDSNRQTTVSTMNTFFTDNKVSSFEVNHQGKRDESGFVVGTLTTANGNFRVNCFLKKIQNKYLIHQIRIDKINE